MSIGAQAQDAATQEPKGKAIVQVFGNFNTGFGSENNSRGFELERSYLGYEYNLGNGLSVKSVLDIGKSSDVSDNNRLAYVKNAMVSWKRGNMTLNGGLISTTQFNFQEKFWGYRYIMKDFQDMYKFGSSADLGLSFSYKFAEWISADAIIVNGEGYKKIQINDSLNYGAGVTLTPAKGFQIRLYGGINEGADNSKALYPRRRGRMCNSGNLVTSDYWLQDASYIRLKNLTIGYTLPLKTKAVEKVRFYFSGENLAYWSPMKKWTSAVDPEVATTGAYGDMLYPYAKTFSFGVDITF